MLAILLFIFLKVNGLIIPISGRRDLTANKLQESVSELLVGQFESLSVDAKAALVKRQDQWSKTLVATFHYTCPRGGLDQRAFVWRATLNLDTRRVTAQGVAHISSLSRVVVHEHEFGFYWYGNHCVEGPGRLCSYTYQGFAQGEVTWEGLSMSLITQSTHPGALPKVTEVCILQLPSPAPQTCGSYEAQDAEPCVIHSIEIHIAN